MSLKLNNFIKIYICVLFIYMTLYVHRYICMYIITFSFLPVSLESSSTRDTPGPVDRPQGSTQKVS